MVFLPYHLQCLKHRDGSFRLGTDSHGQHINDNVFRPDSVLCSLPDNLSGHFHTSFGGLWNSVFIQCKADHHTAVFFHKREDHVHGFLFSADGIDHRLSIINPHGALHGSLIHRINLQRQARNALKLLYNFLHHGRLINIRQAHIDVQNMGSLLLLADAFL